MRRCDSAGWSPMSFFLKLCIWKPNLPTTPDIGNGINPIKVFHKHGLVWREIGKRNTVESPIAIEEARRLGTVVEAFLVCQEQGDGRSVLTLVKLLTEDIICG